MFSLVCGEVYLHLFLLSYFIVDRPQVTCMFIIYVHPYFIFMCHSFLRHTHTHDFPLSISLFQHCGLCGVCDQPGAASHLWFWPFLHRDMLHLQPPLNYTPRCWATFHSTTATAVNKEDTQCTGSQTHSFFCFTNQRTLHSQRRARFRSSILAFGFPDLAWGFRSVSVAPRCCGISERLSETMRRYYTRPALEEARSFHIMWCIKECVQIKAE